MTDPNRVRQEEELIALRSIFGDDWRDLPAKKTAWGTVVDEGWWEVDLRAREDERVKVTLKGKFPKQYPSHPPQLVLNDPKNLSADHVKVLNKVLQEQARAKVGDAMIYDLVEFAQDWISDNHLSLPNPNEVVPTLMEQMAQREQAQRDAERAKIEAERERRLAQAAEQDRLLTEKIQLDASRKSERAKQAEQEADARRRQEALAVLADGELESRSLVLDEDVSVSGYSGSWRSWVLFGGRREPMWTTYFAEPDTATGSTFVRSTLPTVAVHVVDFAATYYSTPQGSKKIDQLSNEISRLRDIRSSNVAQVFAVKRGKSPKGWERLYIMTENIRDGGKMSGYVPKDGFGEMVARRYLGQLLIGLSDIHKAKSLQRQIDLNSVLLAPGPGQAGEMVVKLCSTSFAKRIADLHLSNPFLRKFEESTPVAWRSPEEVESLHEYTIRRDVWHAGLVFLQLIFGEGCLHVYHNLEILLQNSTISGSTVTLLRGMMHLNPKKRLSADEALDRLKQDESSTSMSRLDRSTSSSGLIQSPSNLLGTSPTYGRFGSYFSQSSLPRQSRYREDFIEVEFLGKGGFGEVVKARNKLDGRTYAIKKVKLRQGDDQQRVYREVQNMSGVNHQHIVRYFTCWLEDVQPPEPEAESETASESEGGTPSTQPGAITAFDPGYFQPNFDDISFSRPENSRSASFPSVRFANDDDDEEDEDGSSEDDSDSDTDSDGTVPDPSSRPAPRAIGKPRPKASLSLTNTTSEAHSVKTILYIAMEFVEKQTLRELISAGISQEEGWTLLKQILDALAHLASIKIVHRDLKPSNILINSRNQVKIADFGLSTTDISVVDPLGVTMSGSIGDMNGEIDRTSNIGTGLYIAPEVAVSRSYDEKADMYSLGVIFFEMCFRFDTQMERAHILTALRLPNITFPPAWSGMVDQQKIVSMLLQHDPGKRPTAEQLLRDPLVPNPERDHQRYLEAITELSNPSSTHYPRLVDALFDPNKRSYSTSADNRLDDYTYDNPHDDDLQIWITVVQQRIIQLFQRHGAVETHLPLLTPETSLLSAFRPPGKPAKLLDPSGKLTRLPTSNLLGMARNATRRQIERIKRYHIGDRYEAKYEGQPTVYGEISFDIISPISSVAAEAELLDLIDKVLAEYTTAGDDSAFKDYELHVSHEGVLAMILSIVPEKCRADVTRLFRDSGAAWSSDAKMKLNGMSGIPKPIQDELEQCCIVNDFNRVRHKLEATLSSISASSRGKLKKALDELGEILVFARAAGVTRPILFRPTMSRRADFFRGGFMFEVVRRSKAKSSNNNAIRDLVAFGGRYDSLLNHFRDPAKDQPGSNGNGGNKPVYGVGMSIATDLFARTVKKYGSSISSYLMNITDPERSFGLWTPARCDVYVVDVGNMDLAGRLKLTGELWRGGIRADLQYTDGRPFMEVERECSEQNILFMVLPKVNKNGFKIISVLRRTEYDMTRDEMVNQLRTLIADQRRIDAAHAGLDPAGHSQVAVPGMKGHGYGHQKGVDFETKWCLPEEPNSSRGTKGRPIRKHRHGTKAIYESKVEAFWARVGKTIPLVALDLDSSLLSRLTLSPNWVAEDEAWRAIFAELPTYDRKYAEQVRTAVREIRETGGVISGGTGVAGGGGGIAAGGSAGNALLSSTGGSNVSGASSGNVAGGAGGGGVGGVNAGDVSGAGVWMWLFSVREAKGFLLQTK